MSRGSDCMRTSARYRAARGRSYSESCHGKKSNLQSSENTTNRTPQQLSMWHQKGSDSLYVAGFKITTEAGGWFRSLWPSSFIITHHEADKDGWVLEISGCFSQRQIYRNLKPRRSFHKTSFILKRLFPPQGNQRVFFFIQIGRKVFEGSGVTFVTALSVVEQPSEGFCLRKQMLCSVT